LTKTIFNIATYFLITLILTALIFTGGCSSKNLNKFQETREMMGTYISITLYAENEEGQWGHVRYLFEAYVRDTTGFPPPDDTADDDTPWITNVAIASIVAGAAVAVVIVFVLRRRGKI